MNYLAYCTQCGHTTSKQYARAHNGQCKACAEPQSLRPTSKHRASDGTEYERQIARAEGGDMHNEYYGYDGAN